MQGVLIGLLSKIWDNDDANYSEDRPLRAADPFPALPLYPTRLLALTGILNMLFSLYKGLKIIQIFKLNTLVARAQYENNVYNIKIH